MSFQSIIEINTSKVQGELRNHPDFISRLLRTEIYFNSDSFSEKDRASLYLHEGAHLVYSRELGFEPELCGPSIDFDETFGVFRSLDGSTEGLPREIKMNADPLAVAKQLLGPAFVEEKLLNHYTPEHIWLTAKGDLKNFNNWYVERLRLKGDVPLLKTEAIREAVYRDCRKPAFRWKLWDAAREFEARVFGKAN